MTAPKIVLPYINLPTRSVFYGRCSGSGFCFGRAHSMFAVWAADRENCARTLSAPAAPVRHVPCLAHGRLTDRSLNAQCAVRDEPLASPYEGASMRLPQRLRESTRVLLGIPSGSQQHCIGTSRARCVRRGHAMSRHGSPRNANERVLSLGRPEDAAGDNAGTIPGWHGASTGRTRCPRAVRRTAVASAQALRT